MIHQTLKDFLQYLKNPNPFIRYDKPSVFYNQLFPLVIIALMFAFSSVIFTGILEFTHIIPKMPEFDLFKNKEQKGFLFLMVVVVAPILEELIFRFQLKNFSFGFVCYFIVISYLLSLVLETRILIITMPILAVVLISIYFSISFKKLNKLIFIKRFFPFHFYLTAICFGLVHLSNFSNPFEYGFPVILLVMPQLFAGLILGYVRMRFGLSKSMMMHAAYNLIPALALIAGY
ncbi:MAG: CPBP family intramembrane metalloprotease [Bacteroidetes bacterium]|nr:CPBP family intramembrane metalloprotease [Bacteroidota bacterium]MBU1373062.1 CPBP family intramembrane metalloprotease [Bacteroidota bacterium]MBU1484243.1 CPBP family intramembrane metalloprotease [Bacteroidota bacterium]MBU1761777.1 CPBP family intramembrane metalloprotease [Bacteroidota bacterium]MBU2046483.1 CPBP family intramembrane metalloprotease [Bacteroidota bacterium]